MRGESAVLKGVLWQEKYRPAKLEDVALDEGTRKVVSEYLDAGEIPHLLFLGPAGGGKTTVARILTGAIDCSLLELNASAERGIDTIRDRVGDFATSMLGTDWNVVFLDEADALTADAQTALRNLIEAYAERTRFILTANYGHKIIDALQSRCQLLEFGRPPMKERHRILSNVLAAEGIQADRSVVLGYAEHYPDMRKMLSAAQRAWLSGGKVGLPPATEQMAATGEQLFRSIQAKDWAMFKRLTATPGFDVQLSLRELFWAIPDDHPKAGPLRVLIARGVHESGFTPEEAILFLGVVSDAFEVANSR